MLRTRPRPVHGRARLILGAALALLALASVVATHQASGASSQPNVLFILTDDMTSSELAGMPNVQSLLASQGTTFNRFYISFPLCCPSRATMLSGQYMHNHGVHGNNPPNGGWPVFRPHESNDLADWMQNAGYYTVHIGKYLNFYASANPELPVPPAWDQWYGKVSEDALYYDYTMIEKTSPTATPHITFYGDRPDDYQTDVFSHRALDFIDNSTSAQRPFLLDLWFNSPHGPFDPAPRDLYKLAGTPLPRLPAFNEKDMSDKPKWLQRETKFPLSKLQIKTIANERLRQQEQLISVDQSVGQIVQTLKDKGILDNTYIIFTSDNGIFRGEHRIASGKYLPYDPASRVPFVIRGPGIPAGATSNELVWNGDIPQTIMQIATGSENPSADGRSLLPYAEDPTKLSTRPILLEGDTGPGSADEAQAASARARDARVSVEGKRGVKNLEQEPDAIKSAASVNSAPAYRSIRTDRYEYTIYSNGQSELYDMKRDPAQLNSVVKNPRYRLVKKWLYSQLIPLSSCVAAQCRVEIGPDPAPLSKKALNKKHKKHH